MKRMMKWVAGIVGVAIVAFAVFFYVTINSVINGKHVYETAPPVLPAELPAPAILIFSKTNGYRHAEAIPACNQALLAMAKRRGWSVFQTENSAVFDPAMLQRFQATVWNNTSGDTLSSEQRAAFQSYIEHGGGFVGIHGAGGDPKYFWPWYPETLLGAQFKGHPLNPQFQTATIHVEDRGDPATRNLPAAWTRVDEWYSFEQSPRAKGVHVLATLDERSYSPKMMWKDISMGPDHPVIWKHCVGSGRAFYSALGHSGSAYQDPLYLGVLEGGIAWAAGLEGEGCLK